LFCGGGSLLISHEKYINDGKVLAHLGLQSKILPGSLTDLNACVGFRTSSPQQGVNIYFFVILYCVGGGGGSRYRFLASNNKYITVNA
jgi:hypothetical protein